MRRYPSYYPDLHLCVTEQLSLSTRAKTFVSGILFSAILHGGLLLCALYLGWSGLYAASGLGMNSGTGSGTLIRLEFSGSDPVMPIEDSGSGQGSDSAALHAKVVEPEENFLNREPAEPKIQALPRADAGLAMLQPESKVKEQNTSAPNSVKRKVSTGSSTQVPAQASGQARGKVSGNIPEDAGQQVNTGGQVTGDNTEGAGNFAVLGGVNGPSFRHSVTPVYPAQARRRNISGKVLLRVQIDSAGTPVDVFAISSAHEILSSSAIEAIRRSEFNPLMRDGLPVACWTEVTINFKLN